MDKKFQILDNSEGATPIGHMHGILLLLCQKKRAELKQISPAESENIHFSLVFLDLLFFLQLSVAF